MQMTKINSESFKDLSFNMKHLVSSYDDSELTIPASPSLIDKRRNNKLAANGFTIGLSICLSGKQIENDFQRPRSHSDAQTSEQTHDISHDDSKVSDDTASVSFADDQSIFAASEFQKADEEITNSPRLTEAERKAFFSEMTVKAPEFQPSSKVQTPTASDYTQLTTFPDISTLIQIQKSKVLQENQEPNYKLKEKTEICKFWQNNEWCKYGNQCAFAHGEEQLQKRTHVASRFRMTLCDSFMSESMTCQYGFRCQFCHLSRDFSDFDTQRTAYQNLLHENAKMMQARIDMVASPEIGTFNIAMPSKQRLSIFKSVCPEKSETGSRNRISQRVQKKQRSSQTIRYVVKNDKRQQTGKTVKSETPSTEYLCNMLCL